MTTAAYGAMEAYKQVNTYNAIEFADRHRLISILFTGVLDKLAIAKGHMVRNEVAEKGSTIGKVIAILDELRSSLNAADGGELAVNLDGLYDYMQRRLALANVENDISLLDEVGALTREIKSGWDVIRDEVQHAPAD